MRKTLPSLDSSDAPYFDGRPENLLQYLNDVYDICTTAEVCEEDMVEHIIDYAIQGAEGHALCWYRIYCGIRGGYEEFICAIFRLYPGIYANSFFCGPKLTERALTALYGPNASLYMSGSTATCSHDDSEVSRPDSDNANTTESPSSASAPHLPSIGQCNDTVKEVVTFAADPVGLDEN